MQDRFKFLNSIQIELAAIVSDRRSRTIEQKGSFFDHRWTFEFQDFSQET